MWPFSNKIKKIDNPEASYFMHSVSYNGEKNAGEIGLIKKYETDFYAIAGRSWQSFFESDITQDVINKFVLWSIGSGLKLQSEPDTQTLLDNGITIDKEKFSRKIERSFRLHSRSEFSDYSNNRTLDFLASECKKNALISGDCLVVQRVENGVNNIQLIDGANVVNPIDLSTVESGNTVSFGVEKNAKGKHIAYHVRIDYLKTERIPARNSLGHKVAFLVYGRKYRITDDRGMPIIAVVLETIKKLDRYKEAAVGSAEERAKIPFSIEHDVQGSGENPLASKLAASLSGKATQNADDSFTRSSALVSQIAVTENKTAYNLPPGAKMKALESKAEVDFAGFHNPNFNLICAVVGIPPDVAMSLYNSNFSASRAALKDWENTLNIDRKDFTDQFYYPVYTLFLDLKILANKISAPGYIAALRKNDHEIVLAYRNCRFTGANIPHIDPLKEVNAERAKLGDLGRNIPLTTIEAATEALNGGDSEANLSQFEREYNSFNIKEQQQNNG